MAVDARDVERVRALLARAGHDTTPEEEARTSAVLAARLIARTGICVGSGSDDVDALRRRIEALEAALRRRRRGGRGRDGVEPEDAYFKVYVAGKAGNCQKCGRGYAATERIAWVNPIGPVHVGC